MPCVIGADRRAARQRAKRTIGAMLSLYWKDGEAATATRVAMYRESGIPEAEFADAIARMRAGEPAGQVLDDRFVDCYSLAGDKEDCAAGMARFAAVGVTEMVLTFVGENPVADMNLLGEML
jgi:alkanesulfonate monooxygenase SsuD/methylene tetrahydromethanopterin reductase-like flavin-dependent oxidoreductase (luciferase family)